METAPSSKASIRETWSSRGDLGAGDHGSGKECVGTPTVLAQDTLNGKEELCAVSLDMTAVGKAGSRLW